MRFIKSRLPKFNEILPVLGLIAFVVHGWAIWRFFYRLPSWILSSSTFEVISIFAYTNAFALIESFLVLLFLLIVCFILPAQWYKNGFMYNGFITVLVAAISSYLYQSYFLTKFPPMSLLYEHFGITFAVIVALILLARYIPIFRKAVLFVADNFSIMLYLYVPLGLLSLILVTLRLIIG
jgi:hypothetical protein